MHFSKQQSLWACENNLLLSNFIRFSFASVRFRVVSVKLIMFLSKVRRAQNKESGVISNSGWKGPCEVSGPRSCSVQGQVWGQTRLLTVLSSQVYFKFMNSLNNNQPCAKLSILLPASIPIYNLKQSLPCRQISAFGTIIKLSMEKSFILVSACFLSAVILMQGTENTCTDCLNHLT